MIYRVQVRSFIGLIVGVLSLGSQSASAGWVSELLVADRLSNSIFRYDSNGALLGLVVSDNTNINQATGVAISPDYSSLYVSSFQGNQVVKYDYDRLTGTATNATVFATASDGLAQPSAIRFSPDGNRIYVSNLGGGGIAQFNLDGTSAGALIDGGSSVSVAGMAFRADGRLLVAGFDVGTVAASDASIASLSDFIGPNASLSGASGLLIDGDGLYVSSLFASNIQRFDVTTGDLDNSFLISGLAFPQDLILAPDGNGFLVGVLGFADGAGNISQYAFDGSFVGTFASSGSGGFNEATAFALVPTLVPEPSSFVLIAVGFGSVVAFKRRRPSECLSCDPAASFQF